MILEQKLFKKIVHDYLAEISAEENKPLLDIAMQLEKIALEDEYFVKRKLYPNVDFYSGILLKSHGNTTINVYSYLCIVQNCRLDVTLVRNG